MFKALKRHEISVHLGAKLGCDKCDKKFKCKQKLKNHVRYVHEGRGYACNQCDKQFTDKSYLKTHKEAVHERKKFTCDKCDMIFPYKGGLQSHLEWHELKDQGLKYSCKECDKTFSRKEYFLSHHKMFHKGKEKSLDIVLDDGWQPSVLNENISNQDKSKMSEKQIQNETTQKGKDKKGLRKFKKGKWIVKLERINV